VSKFTRHFFVCQTSRPVGAKPSCGARGSAEIMNGLQEGLAAHPDLWGSVNITATGCLGPCFDGPTIVVYPEATWYCGVKRSDVNEIVETHMVGGKPVDRLVYRWPDPDGADDE
jgi:(2Fe-2S) ferredoxin